MKIVEGHTAATLAKVIAAEIKTIIFKITFATAAVPVGFKFSQILAGIKISLSHVGDGNPTRLYTNMPAEVLAEYDASFEGVVRGVEHDGSTGVRTILFGVPVSEGGSLSLVDDDQLQLNVQGLPTGTGASTDVYGLEVPSRDTELMQIKQMTVPADTPEKQFRLDQVEALIIPREEFDEVEIGYTNGTSCRYTVPELEYLAARSNEAAFGTDLGKSFSAYSDYVVINVDEANKLNVYRDGGDAVIIYTVNGKVVRNPAQAVVTNSRLESTTVSRKIAEAQVAAK